MRVNKYGYGYEYIYIKCECDSLNNNKNHSKLFSLLLFIRKICIPFNNMDAWRKAYRHTTPTINFQRDMGTLE